MSYGRMNFYSYALNQRIDITVILPEYPGQRIENDDFKQAFPEKMKFPAAYLLNGFTGDYTDWFTMMPIEKFVGETGIAAIIPSGMNAWYEDQAGMAMKTFIARELPAAAEAFFPVSNESRHRFIGGISMGGRGAAMISAAYPDSYRAAASLSGPVFYENMIEAALQEENAPGIMRLRYTVDMARGNRNTEEMDYTFVINKLLDQGKMIPELLYLMGKEDAFYAGQYVRLEKYAKQHGLPIEMYEYENMRHDFDFWIPAAEKMFRWFRERC